MQDNAHRAVFQRLKVELRQLDQEDKAGSESRATVALDQQSVGRLSRMDALQQQALAQATARRRDTRRRRIHAAIARLEEGEFGYCEDCGDTIAPARLDLDLTAPKCMECARAG